MKILQMGIQDLSSYVSDIAQENPVLEIAGSPRSVSSSGENFDLLSNVSDMSQENNSLYDHLWSQFICSDIPDKLKETVHFLINRLNRDGFLEENEKTLSKLCHCSAVQIGKAIALLQTADPAGVGARDIKECLKLQAMRLSYKNQLPLIIIEDYLPLLASRKYKDIAAETCATEDDILEAADFIRTLDPHPCAGFEVNDKAQFVTPDILVHNNNEGKPEITLNNAYMPQLSLSSYYTGLLKTSQDGEVKKYIQSKTSQARWIISAIEQRQKTLLLCASEIVKREADFFTKGPGFMAPLSMAQVADALNIHESTVSRTVKDKYLECEAGIFPVSYFFSRALGSDRSGSVMSTTAAKIMLKKLIESESRRRPLSDQKLSELMEKGGCSISRRTIAKYREELGIPAASGRKIK